MKRLPRFLIIAGCSLLLVIVIAPIRHYQLKHAVDAYQNELKEKGWPMELSQVLPAPVPSLFEV